MTIWNAIDEHFTAQMGEIVGMGALEQGKEKHEAPHKQPEGKNLTVSVEDQKAHVGKDAEATVAMAQKQMEKGQLPNPEIVSDTSKMHSDKPKNGATLEDGPNGHKRVSEVKYEDGKSRKFTYDKEGHLTKYKDKDGHEWERDKKDPNQWNQLDGKSSMRGQMIVGKDGEFKFVNYDKKHVSHYDANGNEKKEGRQEISTMSANEKAEVRMQGNAFANTGEPQDVNPPDPSKMTVAERDQHYRDQAMNVVDGAGQAIEGAVNQVIDSLPVPKEAKDVLKAGEQAVAGFIGEAVHTVIGLGSLISPHRPENAMVQQAENATEQAMNQAFGPVSPTDYAGRAMREMLIRGIGTAVTPIGTAGDIAHGIIDPLATAGNYYFGQGDADPGKWAQRVGGGIGEAVDDLKDPRTAGQAAFQAALVLAPLKGLGGVGKAAVPRIGIESRVAGLLEDGSSAFKAKPGGAGDAFTAWHQRPWAKQAVHEVQGEVVEEAGDAAKHTVKTPNPHEDIVDVEPIK